MNSKKPFLYVYIFHTCKMIIHSLSEAADSVSQMSSLGSLRNLYFLMKNSSYTSKFVINLLVRNAMRQSLQVLNKKKLSVMSWVLMSCWDKKWIIIIETSSGVFPLLIFIVLMLLSHVSHTHLHVTIISFGVGLSSYKLKVFHLTASYHVTIFYIVEIVTPLTVLSQRYKVFA